MKRSIIFFVFLASLVVHGQVVPLGDINHDGETGVADLTKLVHEITAATPYWAGYDMNCDGEVGVADITKLVSIVMGNDEAAPTYSGTLPVMFINTLDKEPVLSRTNYVDATYYIDPMGTPGIQPVGSPDKPMSMSIRGRGNSTWLNIKRPYRIKLNNKQSLLGIAPNKHYCLMTHAEDWHGFLHDEMGFEVSRRMGMPFTVDHKPLELVMNGTYLGLYFLTQKIRVASNCVDIIEQQDNATDPNEISGGWLIEISNYNEDNQVVFQEGGKHATMVTVHTPEKMSDAQYGYIKNFLEQTDALIYTSDKEDNSWEDRINVDSLACFYIVNEIVDDTEAFSGSCWMYKNRGETEKLIFGPVWDFGNSMERWNHEDQFYYLPSFIYISKPLVCFPHWISEIAKFPHFQQVVRQHWVRFYQDNDENSLLDYIDRFTETISSAAQHDFIRWPMQHGNQLSWRHSLYKDLLMKKLDFLNDEWGDNVPLQ